jgi:AcrR family transcriptional regulator
MTDVTPATAPEHHYHHGDLPNALRRAAVEVIDERGLGAFSLREVARRAGVSHTAPAHHFGDMRGLLTSLATEGFDALYHSMCAAAEGTDDPVERLARLAEAYVELARSNHAHCEVMFRIDIIDPDDVTLQTAGMRAYGVLEGTLQAIIDAEGLDVPIEDATWLCWTMVQGLVVLGPKFDVISAAKGNEASSPPALARRFSDLIVNGLRGTRSN